MPEQVLCCYPSASLLRVDHIPYESGQQSMMTCFSCHGRGSAGRCYLYKERKVSHMIRAIGYNNAGKQAKCLLFSSARQPAQVAVLSMQMPKLLDYAPYKLAYKAIVMRLVGKGKRAAGTKDPQAGTGAETFTMDQFVELCSHLLKSAAVDAGRDLSMATMMYSCCGRSDDIGLVFLPDIMKPRLIKHIGASHS